jgi:spore maturation protein CgeB
VQHFAEKWAALLSRMLQLEALSTDPPALLMAEMPTIAITVTRDDPQAGWGDWYTAHELGDALEAAGYRIAYAERHKERWYDLDPNVVAVICLLDSYDVRRAPAGALTMAWVRNWADRWIERPWFGEHNVYIPSSSVIHELLAKAGAAVTEVIPLATNVARFYPRPLNEVYANDYVATSNYWKATRPGIEEIIVRPGEKFSIYGKGWADVPRLSRYVRGHLPYDELPEIYSSSKIVIDETATPTLPYGAINSRVFDAAACGALVISNNKLGSAELFNGALPVYADAAEQRQLLDRFLADEESRHATAERLRETVLARHTYRHRAGQIPDAARQALLRPRIALKIGSPDQESAGLWGDTHFAEALAKALRGYGARPQIHLLSDWETPAAQAIDVAIHIRGLGTYVPKAAHINLLWIISHPDEVTPEECNGYDRVLVASHEFAEQLAPQVDVPVEVMLQATDPARFRPDPDPELAVEVLFAGNSRGQRRMAVESAIEIGAPLRVYGHGWEGSIPEQYLAGGHFPNERLGALYSSAGVTLNDHWPEMMRHGFISNRVFDIIASGGLVFTDPVAGLDQVFGDLVPTFDSSEALQSLLDDWRTNQRDYASRMEKARKIVLESHTFQARASRIMEIIAELEWDPLRTGS